MRRFLPLLTLCLLAGLALAPSPGRAGPAAQPLAPDAPAQGAAEPVVEASVHGSALLIRTIPGGQVLVELTDAEGEEKGSSAAIADEKGEARIQFGSYAVQDGNLIAISVGGNPVTMAPGDTLRILQVGAPPREIEIPNLTADVDVESDTVAGTGPAGAQIEAEIRSGDQVLSRSATVGSDGRWSIDVSDPGGADVLAVGSSEAQLSMRSADNYRFSTRAADFRSRLTMNANQIGGRASAGTQIALAIQTAEGQNLEYEPVMAVDGQWSLELGPSFGPGPIGPGPGQGPPSHRIAAGDQLTFTQTGGPMDADRSWTVTLPEIQLDVDPQSETVSGNGPADVQMGIEARSVWNEEADASATTAPDGSFSVDLSESVDLGPGWRVSAWWQTSEAALTVAGSAIIPVVQAGVDVPTLSGLAQPGQRITVTLSSSAGQQKSRQITRAGSDGRFGVQHRAPAGGGVMLLGGGIPAEQGDRIEVELTAGDPLVFTVPELTAVTNAISDTVSGSAPAGQRMRLEYRNQNAVEGQVAGDGSYTVDLTGRHDIAPGSRGRLTVFDDRGHTFYTSWAAPRLSLQIGTSQVGGVGAPGRQIEARLLAPDGSPVAEAETNVLDLSAQTQFGLGAEELAELQGSFFLSFTDIAGQPVPVQAGDTLRLYSGLEEVELTVPPLDGTVLVESDLVTGRSEPGRSLTIEALPFGGGRASVEVTADENGNFSHDFAGQPDLRYNDIVALSTDVEGHGVGRTITIPGLTLEMDASRLSGTIWRATRFILEARRDGTLLASAPGISSESGEFSAQLLDADGDPLPLREGDELSVTQITRQDGDPLRMTVPELTVSADVATDRVAGLATPGGRLVVLARGADSDFGISQAWPEIAGDGSWQADFIPGWDVAPGTAVAAQYRLPEGHVALRTYYVPQLRAQIGGPNVCGFTRPGGAVTAFLRDDDTSLASARARARYDGRFQAVLGNARGNLINTRGGQNIGADLGTGSVINLRLPQLDLDVDWQDATLTGSGPAEQMLEIQYPARRCMENLSFGGGFLFAILTRIGEDGQVQAGLPFTPLPGEGIELRMAREDGHESFLQLYRPLGRVFVETPRVTGLANAGADLSFELLDFDLQPKASALALSDANGGFEALLTNSTGDLVPMQPEDTLEISMSGSVVARIVVEPLSFDWSRGEPIIGSALPSRPVSLELLLEDGRVLSIPRVTSGNGQWSFTATEVPTRANWSLDDITAVRATIDTLDAHQIIFQTPGFEIDDPAPRPPTTRLYLPFLGNGAVTRAAWLAEPGQPDDAALPAAPSGVSLARWSIDAPAATANPTSDRGSLPGSIQDGFIHQDDGSTLWILKR